MSKCNLCCNVIELKIVKEKYRTSFQMQFSNDFFITKEPNGFFLNFISDCIYANGDQIQIDDCININYCPICARKLNK